MTEYKSESDSSSDSSSDSYSNRDPCLIESDSDTDSKINSDDCLFYFRRYSFPDANTMYCVTKNFKFKRKRIDGCMCCGYKFDNFIIQKNSLEELIQHIPNNIINDFNEYYKWFKKLNLTDYTLIDNDNILYKLFNINIDTVYCNTCGWSGPSHKYLSLCPLRKTYCSRCQDTFLAKQQNQHTHTCPYCKINVGNDLNFDNHKQICNQRQVKCIDCWWTGSFNIKESHKCMVNPMFRKHQYELVK